MDRKAPGTKEESRTWIENNASTLCAVGTLVVIAAIYAFRKPKGPEGTGDGDADTEETKGTGDGDADTEETKEGVESKERRMTVRGHNWRATRGHNWRATRGHNWCATRGGKCETNRVCVRYSEPMRAQCHRLFWGGSGKGDRPLVGGKVKTRFFESLIVWGLKKGFDKFKDGVLDASKAQGGALANAGIGWVLGSVFGIDLSKPDQQAITNQKLEAISKTLEEHTKALANIESKVDETNRLLTSFITMYAENLEMDRAVNAFTAADGLLAPYRNSVRTYSKQLKNYARDAATELHLPGEFRAEGFSPAIRTNVVRLVNNIYSYIDTAYDAIFAAVTDTSAKNILALFEKMARLTRQGGAAYPRFLSPDMLDALWVHYYGLYGSFIEAADLLLEASHVNVSTFGAKLTPPSLAEELSERAAAFEQHRKIRMPPYMPLDSELPFFIDPENGFALSAVFLKNPTPPPQGAPEWATSIWTRTQADEYLKTAVIGGLRGWRLPKFEILRDLAAEAHIGLKLKTNVLGVRPLLDALGFRLDFPAVGYTNPILAATGGIFLSASSWVPEVVPSAVAGHLLVWLPLAPNAD